MFKFLIIFILLLAFVPGLRKFLFWLVVGRQMVNQQKTEQKASKEGEVKVNFKPNTNNRKDEGGQYVDYEEVK